VWAEVRAPRHRVLGTGCATVLDAAPKVTVRREHVTQRIRASSRSSGWGRDVPLRQPLSLDSKRDGASTASPARMDRRLDSKDPELVGFKPGRPARAGGAGHDVSARPPGSRSRAGGIRQHVVPLLKLRFRRNGWRGTTRRIRWRYVRPDPLKIASPDSKKELYEVA